jgi:hypothetical protein
VPTLQRRWQAGEAASAPPDGVERPLAEVAPDHLVADLLE